MLRSRPWFTVLSVMGCAAGLTWWLASSSVQGQVVVRPGIQPFPGMPIPDDQPPSGDDNRKAAQYSSLRLLEKSEFRQLIKVAADCVQDKAWDDCVAALQKILDEPSDSYAQVKEKDPAGNETVRWASVKFEAYNLLNKMPEEGLDVYELKNGARARDLLVKAKDTGKHDYLIECATKYLHTKSGAEANEILATLLLDRGQYFMSALRFEKQLALNPSRFKVEDITLFKTSLAYRRAGDLKKAEAVWKKLENAIRDKGGLKVGEEFVSLDNLARVLENIPRPATFSPSDWPQRGGNLAANAQAAGSPPWLDMLLWERKMFFDKEPDSVEPDRPGEIAARDLVKDALKKSDSVAVIPGFHPITANKVLVYRTPSEVRAVALADMKGAKAGEILWKSTTMDGSLVDVLDDSQVKSTFQQWIQLYNQTPGFSTFLYENTLVGSLSTDHRNVYAIDDLMVPAHPNSLNQYQQFGFNPNPNIGGLPEKVKPLVGENVLYAFDIYDGRARWSLGGGNIRASKDTGTAVPDKHRKDPFNESHFLGAPIAVGNKLYVLNEKNQGMTGESDLRLVCIDPNKVVDCRPHIVDVQTLGSIRQHDRVTHNMGRRTHAVHLAYGEGILVCPTHTGEVLGVDLLSKSLVWSYPYREQQSAGATIPNPNPRFNPQPVPLAVTNMANWKSSPPVIQDGKVVFTAPDANSVHCINLRDGTFRWKKKQLDGDLYLAGVVNDRVIVVGRNAIRGLALDDGKLLWNIATGDAPSGHGVANKGVYYLPLRKGELLAVDVERGVIRAHNRAKKSGVVPGNLVFSDGAVISVTAEEVSAFPQLMAKLDQANDELKQNPRNPNNLFVRGELLLADGQVQSAVNDLQEALKNDPSPELAKRVKNKLYEALTDLLQTDFNRVSDTYLKEYEELCSFTTDALEREERQAMFYRIVGQGRESQGKLVEAFTMYRKFGELPIHQQRGGITSIEDPTHKIPVNVWLRGRVSAMIAAATPSQREPLEEKIAEEWKAVEAQKNPDSIRSFIGMFDVPFTVGRAARLKLAETLIDRNERGSFLEAEMCLYQLRGEEFRKDVESGGKSLAALALLEEKKGTADSMKQAASYYRQLAEEFPTSVVRVEKNRKLTGKDLFNELATDKRFWPYLEDTKSLWKDAKLGVREVGPGNFGAMQGIVLYPEGDTPALLRNHRLVLDSSNPSNPQLRLIDVATLQPRWQAALGSVPANLQFYDYLNRLTNLPTKTLSARYRTFQVMGNILVLQAGTTVYCLDLDQGKILWQNALIDLAPGSTATFQPDAEGNMEMYIWNQMQQNRTKNAIGMVGAVQPGYVAVVGSKGLQVLDPLTGGVQWKKIDVSAGTRVFGDDQYLFLVEVSDSGSVGVGRVLRANDGQQIAIPDFSTIFQYRLHVDGRRILAAVPKGDEVHLKLYDIVAGKDVWTKSYPKGHMLLKSPQPELTGTMNPQNGDVTVYDANSGAVLLASNIVKGRITDADLKNVKDVALFADADRFYFALNQPIDGTKVSGGVVHNNFQSGLLSYPVNGWFLALYRNDGSRKISDTTSSWKKGDLAWHTIKPMLNQMLLIDQFQQVPILVFTSRVNELIGGGAGGIRWISLTHTVHKQTGKVVFDPGVRPSNAQPQFYAFVVNVKDGTMNLMGYTGTVQHYVDDGRKRDNASATGPMSANTPPAPVPVGVRPPNGNLPPNGLLPVNPNIGRIIIQPRIVPAPMPVPLPAPVPEKE